MVWALRAEGVWRLGELFFVSFFFCRDEGETTLLALTSGAQGLQEEQRWSVGA
jgi:hypothetical protein